MISVSVQNSFPSHALRRMLCGAQHLRIPYVTSLCYPWVTCEVTLFTCAPSKEGDQLGAHDALAICTTLQNMLKAGKEGAA